MDRSTFSWLAYSEREQRYAQDLASLLSERDTRDELGVGSIRDALANRLFPGTSTIMSRARYFLFLPWIFQELERQPRSRARQRGELAERALIASLRQSTDTRGLVGSQTSLVERLPSSIYWNGLLVLGIRRDPRPLSAYYRWLEDPRRLSRVARDDDGVAIEGRVETWWDRLPASPPDFPEGATFALTGSESRYLAGRAAAATPYPTMLAFLFHEAAVWKRVTFPWQHPMHQSLPSGVRDDLAVAEHFSLLQHGAALLYNQLIAEACSDDARIESYRARLHAWQNEATAAIGSFDLGRVWGLASHTSGAARGFVEEWRKAVVGADMRPLADSQIARQLIRSQEIRVKGTQRSRIANPLRVPWNGASGSTRLDYRWQSSVQQIALDVAEGRDGA